MIPGDYTVEYTQGETLTEVWIYETGETEDDTDPVDLTGYSARLQVRDAMGTLLVDATSTGVDPQITLNVSEDGEIRLVIEDEDTADHPAGNYKYDLRLDTPDEEEICLIAGAWIVREGQTRA